MSREALLVVMVRLALVVALVAAVIQAQAAATYRVPHGSVTFHVRPAWPGGRLVMPLGPAGEFALHTHRTPLDIEMAYRLPDETKALTVDGLTDGLPAVQDSARAAFSRYLAGRVPWLLIAGLAAGALIATGRHRWRATVWGAVAGAGAVVLLGGGLALLTLGTVDRSPAVEYRGLARNVPRVLPLVRALGAGTVQADALGRLQDFVDGLESVATQLRTAPALLPRDRVIRVLLVSDVHDNVFGMRAAARLAAGGGAPVDAVLVAGDVTDLGRREEAQLFLRAFRSSGAPVVFVGGNHEDMPALRVFAAAGYHLLEESSTTVGGLTVYGGGDPMSVVPRVDSDPEALVADAERLLAGWKAASRPPQLLLVHDIAQAGPVAEAARKAGRSLVVAYGNDHVAGVRRDGSVTYRRRRYGGRLGLRGHRQRPWRPLHLPAHRLLTRDAAARPGRDVAELRRRRAHARGVHAAHLTDAAHSRAAHVQSTAGRPPAGGASVPPTPREDRMDRRYDPHAIEQKWQRIWKERDAYRTPDTSDKPKFYCLDFFPYPSGDGLSVGHCRNYVPTDVVSRLRRMQGSQRASSHGLGRLWTARRELRHQDGRQAAGHDRDATSPPITGRWT